MELYFWFPSHLLEQIAIPMEKLLWSSQKVTSTAA